MNPTDLNRLQLMVTNTQWIKKEFAWQPLGISRLAAMLYAAEDREADPASIRDAHDRIKANTGAFSTFRGNLSVGIAAMLSLSDDPQARLNDTLHVYEMMKAHQFGASDYLVLAAYEIAQHANPERYEEAIVRTRTFYDGMKKNHRMLTSHDDYVFAAMLGLSDLEPEASLKRMEQLYAELKPELRAGNGLQALTQLLVLGEADLGTGVRLLELRDLLRQRKIRLDKEYTLPSLGLLALLPQETRILADEIEENAAYLREQKGFGAWSILDQELLLIVSSLLVSRSVNDARQQLSAPAASSVLANLLIAQQAAAIASIATVTVIASSSSQ